ncbi:MAG TPA: hypothetical protein VG936_15640 [Lacunisphaera sp.]|nr:hypothetical protein [Lacunisphaera sp.]
MIAAVVAITYQGWDLTVRGASRPMLKGNDDVQYYFWLRSLVIDGDWDFANDVKETPMLDSSERRELLTQPRTARGRLPDKYPLGWALASAPFFLLAHGLSLLLGWPADGWAPFYQYCLWAGHLGITVAGMLVARRFLLRFLPAGAAEVGLLAGWLASPLIYYQTARISMAHGLTFSLVAFSHELAMCIRDDPARRNRWGLLGFVLSLLVVTRSTSVVYCLHPLAVLASVLRDEWRADRSAALRLTWLAASGFVPVGLQLWAWHQVYALWLPNTYGGEAFGFTHPALLEVLFSSWHGWFYWHPLLFPGFLALLWCVASKRLPATWLVSTLLIIYLNSSWWCWWFGSSFGNRAFEGATLYCMAGLGFLWDSALRSRALKFAAIVVMLAVVGNLLLLGEFMTGSISRGDSVSYTEFIRVITRLVGLST